LKTVDDDVDINRD